MQGIPRVQFYPDQKLYDALTSDASRRSIPVSALARDLLAEHYGLSHAASPALSQIFETVKNEAADFVRKSKPGDVFDLNTASRTFADVSMVYAGRPAFARAYLGKLFSQAVRGGDSRFAAVTANRRPDGTVVRTSATKAATYRIVDVADLAR